MRRCVRAAALVTVALLVAGTGAPRASSPSPRNAFEAGVQAYEDQRFGDAARAWKDLVEAGYRDADLFYNLGCAHARRARWGEATLAFRRALHFEPRHGDARANLAWVRERLPQSGRSPAGLRDRAARIAALVPAGPGALLALLLELTAAALVARAMLIRRRGGRAGVSPGVLLFVAAGLVAAPVLLGGALRASERRAVVLPESVELRAGPSEDDPALLTLRQGAEVRLRGDRAGWARVALEEGGGGFVPCGSVGSVDPGAAVCGGAAGDAEDAAAVTARPSARRRKDPGLRE